MTDQLAQAVHILNSGGIIIFPTDTAFGIGCRIDREDAVDRLFELRKRPRTQAVPVLVSSVAMALAYFDHPSRIVRRLMRKYWPGAVTIVAPVKKNLIYSPIRGGGNNIGLRIPKSDFALSMIEAISMPIIGTSANSHGLATPYHFSKLDQELVQRVDLVVKGECEVGNISTVIDVSGQKPRILRYGAIEIDIQKIKS